MRWTRWLLIAALALSGPVHAVKDIELDKVEDQARFQDLANELRCMVCQNQSIADSNADLARDFATRSRKRSMQDKRTKKYANS
jgi:cytochrome c-type biogenesis protein CcmH